MRSLMMVALLGSWTVSCTDSYEGDDPGECSDDSDNDRDGLFDCDDEGCTGSDICDSLSTTGTTGTTGTKDTDTDTSIDTGTPCAVSRTCPGTTVTNASDLAPLQGCTTMSGTLIVHSPSLTTLQELSCVTRIEGSLQVEGNGQLTNLDGLSSLTSVGGSLVIGEDYFKGAPNPMLADLDGLSNLQDISSTFVVSQNPALTNLDGLSNVTSIGSYWHISYNDSLVDLDGLSNVPRVGGGMNISYNPSLLDIDGLSSVASVSGGLLIGYNDRLCQSSVDAFMERIVHKVDSAYVGDNDSGC